MGADEVLKFWFEETPRKFHFNATPAFDAEIRNRFEPMAIDQAALAAEGSHPWDEAGNADGLLALIITLDQFPRNMYRGTPAMFEWDAYLLPFVKKMTARGDDLKVPMERRAFVYMPLMHSENIDDQNQCVKLVDQRLDDDNTLFHAKAHRKLIQRFGRFPHRNKIVERTSRPEEIQYLKDGGYKP